MFFLNAFIWNFFFKTSEVFLCLCCRLLLLAGSMCLFAVEQLNLHMKTKDSAEENSGVAERENNNNNNKKKKTQASSSPDSSAFDHSWSLSAFLPQQLGPQKIVGPTEECRLHHHEAVCDQDQEAGETVKSGKGWVRWECHSSCCCPGPCGWSRVKQRQKKKKRGSADV